MRRVAGFTLVELSIVLVIFGIVSAVALPGINKFLRSMEVNNAANTAAMRLRIARQKAITESNNYNCWWNVFSKDWGWWDDDGSDFMYVSTEKFDVGGTLPDWITVTNSDTNPMPFWIVFTPNGSASASGTLIYSNADGYSRSVSIIRSTGMVTVQ